MKILFKSGEINAQFSILIKQGVPCFLDWRLNNLNDSRCEPHHLSALGRDYFEVFEIRKPYISSYSFGPKILSNDDSFYANVF